MWRSAVQVCLGLHNEGAAHENLSWNGGLAQLARASALQAEGQRFESVILHRAIPDGLKGKEIFDILTQANTSESKR
jgi:hypothetical protein